MIGHATETSLSDSRNELLMAGLLLLWLVVAYFCLRSLFKGNPKISVFPYMKWSVRHPWWVESATWMKRCPWYKWDWHVLASSTLASNLVDKLDRKKGKMKVSVCISFLRKLYLFLSLCFSRMYLCLCASLCVHVSVSLCMSESMCIYRGIHTHTYMRFINKHTDLFLAHSILHFYKQTIFIQ